jgi:hypothetical protein
MKHPSRRQGPTKTPPNRTPQPNATTDNRGSGYPERTRIYPRRVSELRTEPEQKNVVGVRRDRLGAAR